MYNWKYIIIMMIFVKVNSEVRDVGVDGWKVGWRWKKVEGFVKRSEVKW